MCNRTTLETSGTLNYTRNEWIRIRGRRRLTSSQRISGSCFLTRTDYRGSHEWTTYLRNSHRTGTNNWSDGSEWKLHPKRVKMRTTIETSEDENYTRNQWKWELHSKRVKMITALETSEDENYTRNEWRWELHSKRVKMRAKIETSEDESYNRNEWGWELKSKRVKMRTTLETSENRTTLETS